MAEIEILKTLSDMTPAWLTEALTEAGHEPPPVTAVQVRPMDGFTGAIGEVGIVTVEYGADTDLPAEMVAKCPLDDDMARLYSSVMLFYKREAGFYADMAGPVADRAGLSVPACYVNLFDPETHDATLLIERIAPAEPGDILAGTSFERMRVLVEGMAAMHGRFWMDPALEGLEWLIAWNEPNLKLGIPIHIECWDNIRQRAPDKYPPEVAALVNDYWMADIEGWLDRLTQRPWTFTHIDYELDNVLFREGRPVIVDWQTSMRSFPGADLSWLLATSHSPETLAREPELLEVYRRGLAASGGPDWTEADLAEELAWGAFYWSSVGVIPYMMSIGDAPEEDRAHLRFRAMLEGSIAAAVRWDAVGHIAG